MLIYFVPYDGGVGGGGGGRGMGLDGMGCKKGVFINTLIIMIIFFL